MMLTMFQFVIFKKAKTRPTATERGCKLCGQRASERNAPCQEGNPIRAVVAQVFRLTEKLSAERVFRFIYQTNDNGDKTAGALAWPDRSTDMDPVWHGISGETQTLRSFSRPHPAPQSYRESADRNGG